MRTNISTSEKLGGKKAVQGTDDIPIIYMNEIPPLSPDLIKKRYYRSEKVETVGMEKINAKSTIGKYLVEFATTCTIHGLNHLAAPQRHPMEKFLAAVIIAGGLCCLITLSWIFWYRYQHEATVTVVDHDYEKFPTIQPSVIACSGMIDEKKIKSTFERHGVKDTRDARTFFRFLANATYETMSDTPDFNDVPPEKWLEILHDLYFQLDFASNFEGPMVPAFVTERGICSSVNNYASVYATLEYWLADNWTVVPAPENLPYFDYNTRDLTLTLSAKSAMMFGICNPLQIFEYRHGLRQLLDLHILKQKLAILETTSAKEIKALSVQQRNCKFHDDGGLKMWPIYTHKMSEIECRYSIIRKLCGCHPHFARPMPDIPICNAEQLRCIGKHHKTIIYLEYKTLKKCGYISDCNTIVYDAVQDDNYELKPGSINGTFVNFIIASYPQFQFHREMLFGFTDFLTSVGGAAGLFLGASVLSFVEIFYYLTVRLYFYKDRFNCKKRD